MKMFPNLEELHFHECLGFSHKDLLVLTPSTCLYSLTPMPSMITEDINLLAMFPKLIRIILKSLPNISFSSLLNWLINSSVTQFEIVDQKFIGFTLADLILELIQARMKTSNSTLSPVSWIRLSLIYNLLPSNLLPELCDLLTDDKPPLTLIIDICNEESIEAWNIEKNSALKKNTSLDIVLD